MAMAGSSCCEMRSTDTSMPPALASQPENNGLSSHLALTATLFAVPVGGAALVQPAEAPPGAPASGRSSTLRI